MSIEAQLIALQSSIEKQPLFRSIDQQIKLDSKAFNDQMTNIQQELNKLFHWSNEVEQLIQKQMHIFARNQASFHQQWTEFQRSADQLKWLYQENRFQRKGILQSFIAASIRQDARDHQENATIRYGKLQSQLLSIENALKNESGKTTASIRLLDQNGSVRAKGFDLPYVLDDYDHHYWSQEVWLDANAHSAGSNETYAYADLEIIFEQAKSICEIHISPFSLYPIQIESMKSFTSIDEQNGKELLKNPMFISEYTVISVEDHVSTKIQLRLVQKHFEDRWISYADESMKMTAWLDAKKGVWNAFDLAIEMKKPHDSHTSMIKKVKWYEYGLKHIGIYRTTFAHKSSYVSEMIDLDGNIGNVLLDVDEDLPIVQFQNQAIALATVDYAISVKQDPGPSDWIPLLPVGKKIIDQERLYFSALRDVTKQKLFGKLRFRSKSMYAILYKNGIPLPSMLYELDEQGEGIWLLSSFYQMDAIYTIRYMPDIDQQQIQLPQAQPDWYVSSNGLIGEFFEQVDEHYSVQLSRTPYVNQANVLDYQFDQNNYKTNDQLQSSVLVWVNGISFKNITDYSSKSFNRKLLQEEEEGKCFAHIGNRIYFPISTFDGELKNIHVQYLYVHRSLRFRIDIEHHFPHAKHCSPAISSLFMGYYALD